MLLVGGWRGIGLVEGDVRLVEEKRIDIIGRCWIFSFGRLVSGGSGLGAFGKEYRSKR